MSSRATASRGSSPHAFEDVQFPRSWEFEAVFEDDVETLFADPDTDRDEPAGWLVGHTGDSTRVVVTEVPQTGYRLVKASCIDGDSSDGMEIPTTLDGNSLSFDVSGFEPFVGFPHVYLCDFLNVAVGEAALPTLPPTYAATRFDSSGQGRGVCAGRISRPHRRHSRRPDAEAAAMTDPRSGSAPRSTSRTPPLRLGTWSHLLRPWHWTLVLHRPRSASPVEARCPRRSPGSARTSWPRWWTSHPTCRTTTGREARRDRSARPCRVPSGCRGAVQDGGGPAAHGTRAGADDRSGIRGIS